MGGSKKKEMEAGTVQLLRILTGVLLAYRLG
jgi:hypothetical protein